MAGAWRTSGSTDSRVRPGIKSSGIKRYCARLNCANLTVPPIVESPRTGQQGAVRDLPGPRPRPGGLAMRRDLRVLAAVGALLFAFSAADAALAQKRGGILKIGHFDSPASMSMLEESTLAVNRPMMGVFNNLVMFDQQVAQNSPQSIVPDLATEWSWNEEGTELTMPLRHGVKWHDGQPFTAKDVECTWDLLTGSGNDKLRINPRKSWYDNLDAVTTNGDFEVTFRLKRPQLSFLTLLASGWSPVYPCHVPARDMRQQ